jgi:hypothetical protein
LCFFKLSSTASITPFIIPFASLRFVRETKKKSKALIKVAVFTAVGRIDTDRTRRRRDIRRQTSFSGCLRQIPAFGVAHIPGNVSEDRSIVCEASERLKPNTDREQRRGERTISSESREKAVTSLVRVLSSRKPFSSSCRESIIVKYKRERERRRQYLVEEILLLVSASKEQPTITQMRQQKEAANQKKKKKKRQINKYNGSLCFVYGEKHLSPSGLEVERQRRC